MHLLATSRVEFKREKAFKRQNSYVPILEDFGDIDDVDNLKTETAKVRRSFKKDRKKLVSVVTDVIKARYDADMANESDGESNGNKPNNKGPKQPGMPNFGINMMGGQFM